MKFEKRPYQPLEEKNIALTISGRGMKGDSQKFSYILQATVNLRQNSLYQVSLNYQEDFLIIDKSKGETTSTAVTGTIRRTDGEPVELKEISEIELSEYTSEMSSVEATDFQCSGGTFSFRVHLTDPNWQGAQASEGKISSQPVHLDPRGNGGLEQHHLVYSRQRRHSLPGQTTGGRHMCLYTAGGKCGSGGASLYCSQS